MNVNILSPTHTGSAFSVNTGVIGFPHWSVIVGGVATTISSTHTTDSTLSAGSVKGGRVMVYVKVQSAVVVPSQAV